MSSMRKDLLDPVHELQTTKNKYSPGAPKTLKANVKPELPS